ncbi:MAG: hypothetical protein ABSC57_05060, partial [Syntrophales bacterium]
MMKNGKRIIALLAMIALIVGLSGCAKEGPMERAGKKVVLEQADLDMIKETANYVRHACLETVRRPGIAYEDRMVGTAAVRGVCPEYGDMRNEQP